MIIDIDKFLSKVYKNLGCWEWTGKINRAGYGVFDKRLAHEVSWEIYYGEKVETICHHCDSLSCVNPHHLYIPKEL